MEQIVLEATARDTSQHSTVSSLRRQGQVPAIVYGRNQEPVAVAVSERLFQQRGALAKSLVELHMGGEEKVHAIVQQIQRDPVTRRILHIDFYRVEMDKPVTVSVPLHVTGVQEVEKRRGVVQIQTREIEIEARPVDLPEVITVDISGLQPGEHLSVGEVRLPDGVTLKSEPTEVVVSVLVGKQAEDADADAGEATE
ncbi:50S ribosomal protein L25 [Alicyclobacillus shizuokensis]|uniref:50S ribosomal protein L25 n=1 Tax=Alicyclobacillus shizuokensis TaxID=392014 RepID=UPI0008358319|nr:50S ribosomal protein L25 [Alicyclobacillus shizuokensis]MCL6626478.1 50S ribosomal protein L25 [Alicyclobacillus shizuokensis]